MSLPFLYIHIWFCRFLIFLQYHVFQSNVVASGGLGGEVFIWDIEAAVLPVAKSTDVIEDEGSNKLINSGNYGLPMTSLRSVTSSNMSVNNAQSHGYNPTAAKGHKESVYALAMNDSGTLLVSGGTEKVLLISLCLW